MDRGQPVELHEFLIDGVYYRYTSDAEDVTWGLNTFHAVLCRRSTIECTADINRGEVMLDVARNNPFAVLYRTIAPDVAATHTIYRSHDLVTWSTYWMAKVVGVKFNTQAATIISRPMLASVGRLGLRVMHQRQCPYDLYSDMCGAFGSSFYEIGTLTGVLGVTLSSYAFGTKDDGWFTGGYIRIGSSEKRRMIVAHIARDITISHPFDASVIAGASFTAFAGCDKTPTTCKNKFDNKLNFGGDEFLPNTNVFMGDGLA